MKGSKPGTEHDEFRCTFEIKNDRALLFEGAPFLDRPDGPAYSVYFGLCLSNMTVDE